jgi:Acyl-CoA carboxylase epsilon subunit
MTRPTLRIVRGEPTAEELAVITALVSVAGGEADAPAQPLRGRWSDPAGQLRRPITPGPGAWRAALR